MANDKHRFGVMVGVDGSGPSDTAVRWAAHDALLRKCPLTLVHAVAPPLLPWSASQMPAELRQRQERDAQAVLDDAVRIANDTTGDDSSVDIDRQVFVSPPVPTLVDLSNEADMVVVGSHGLGAVHRMLLGSVSSGLLHQARCPVAVVHSDAQAQARPVHDAVLLGIDGSPASELATAIAFEEASLRATSLVALHVWSDTDRTSTSSIEESALRAAAEETLAERLAGWEERYPDVSVTRIVEYDHPATHLLERSKLAQLVVVGSHGRGGFTGMLLGSVSAAVAQAARVPVVVARSH
ncbi:universal stress protein [Mycobacterium europaeum]|uniref:universal stress protein n=1 Tax=Mycobacterium europaeum TaxID=761804 RepID=UPI002AE02796|nr:universal stress protein [Mycobacterium europaeum]MEA1162325.1 universal stress protein [Mycobacterium europaeum]